MQRLALVMMVLVIVIASRSSAKLPRMIVSHDVAHARSAPLREIPPLASNGEEPEGENPEFPPSEATPSIQDHDPVLQTTSTGAISATINFNFDGIPANGYFAAPDSNGSVGTTQYVQWVNPQFAVYNKTTGALVYGPVAGRTLWSNLGGPCAKDNNGDVIAQFDKQADVWVMTQFAVSAGPPYYQCVAVSTTSDATGTYNLYAFQLPGSYFTDYPKLGVWPDAYYMTWNLLNQNAGFTLVAPLVCALDRSAMLAGTSATSICFQLSSQYSSLLPADLDGTTPPPSGSPNYLLNLDVNSLDLWSFHVNFVNTSNSSISGPVNIPVAAFTQACLGCVPQGGTSQTVDSFGDRLMYRLAYRNFGSYESLVTTHSVGSPAGLRWYELRNPGGTPTVYQQGTYAPDSLWRWMGSIAMDKASDIAIGFSVSSHIEPPAIRLTGRYAADPLGTLRSGISVVQGNGAEQGSYRWGDYSTLSVDPVDDCTFWYTDEYFSAIGSFNWRTRIISLKFQTCN